MNPFKLSLNLPPTHTDTTATTAQTDHPMTGPTTPPPNPSHRPVALQSPADLLHLRNTALRAAREKIDLHLPVSTNDSPPDQAAGSNKGKGKARGGDGEGEGDAAAVGHGDDMRRAVERHLAAFVDTVFAGVREGVEVNGLPGRAAVSWDSEDAEHQGKFGEAPGLSADHYDPYDTRLAARITTLHARIETLNLALANTRREAVAKAAADFKQNYLEQDAAMETEIERAEDDGKGETATLPEYGFEGREEEVAGTYEEAVRGLERLRGEMGEARERAEEAAGVVEFMRGRGRESVGVS